MTRSIQTTVCAAAKIVVTPVEIRRHRNSFDSKHVWIVTQKMTFTTHDGQRYVIDIHLEDDCNALMTGEPVVYPPAPESEGESA